MNALIAWTDDLTIGVPEIDAHHRTLVGLLNELHESVHRRRGVDACREVVEKLRRCALSHLEVEEKLMHVSGHAGYSENLEEQRELVRLLDEMLSRMDERNSNITFQGLHELRAWLLAHIRYVDPAKGPAPVQEGSMFALLLKRT